MEAVCASCGKRITVLSGAATLPSCECGGTTWRSCDAPTALVGVVEPAPWTYVGDADDPDSPAFENGWTNVHLLGGGAVEIQTNPS